MWRIVSIAPPQEGTKRGIAGRVGGEGETEGGGRDGSGRCDRPQYATRVLDSSMKIERKRIGEEEGEGKGERRKKRGR